MACVCGPSCRSPSFRFVFARDEKCTRRARLIAACISTIPCLPQLHRQGPRCRKRRPTRLDLERDRETESSQSHFISVGYRRSGLQASYLSHVLQAWKPAEPQQQPSWKKRTDCVGERFPKLSRKSAVATLAAKVGHLQSNCSDLKAQMRLIF